MLKIPFTKMHGIGNDFVMVNALEAARWTGVDWQDLARKVCDRHFGIGSDGLIVILPSSLADYRMRMLNPDGSEAQMCGNGIRCFARHVYDLGLTTSAELAIETLAGVKVVRLNVEDGKVASVRVNMGAPILEAARIPARIDAPTVKDYPLTVGEKTYLVSCVSMGNPHAIAFIDESEVDALHLPAIGPLFEHHPMFPERTNTEFCVVLDRRSVRMRVWERGAGETLACGTGACASAVAAILHNFVEAEVDLILDGGRLRIEWQGDGQPVYMTGPAEYVCDGEYYYGV
ncbi:MAG: diaminopimelate epimerase [Dehalococcoidales bacterium]|nr:diaminopimelate epimerase [Dehalococcoidales bacterium]